MLVTAKNSALAEGDGDEVSLLAAGVFLCFDRVVGSTWGSELYLLYCLIRLLIIDFPASDGRATEEYILHY